MTLFPCPFLLTRKAVLLYNPSEYACAKRHIREVHSTDILSSLKLEIIQISISSRINADIDCACYTFVKTN